MVLLDSNVWLALALSAHVHHVAAARWLAGVDEPASVCFCRATQQSFLRLLTNAAVLAPYGNPPLGNRDAWAAYRALLADDRVVMRDREPAGTEARWRRLALRDTASPKLWMDAYLAAFAVSIGYRLVTTDAAYEQFSELDVEVIGEPSD